LTGFNYSTIFANNNHRDNALSKNFIKTALSAFYKSKIMEARIEGQEYKRNTFYPNFSIVSKFQEMEKNWTIQ